MPPPLLALPLWVSIIPSGDGFYSNYKDNYLKTNLPYYLKVRAELPDKTPASYSIYLWNFVLGTLPPTLLFLKMESLPSTYPPTPKPQVQIDNISLSTTLEWLKSTQDEDGCFEAVGKAVYKVMKVDVGEKETRMPLTAYVLISILEAGE
ncbi:hypothetical protein Pmani_004367 [Petrolisthes manimaculis]|uniref:Alpha-macroglobulin-like TED domain-containing protein n=1 Tax=Petrolisthes manimaculis TaxID=1843537 RepID=A0AAE1QGU5_9EUCA|nr:hypothetical protein Pmani_004367 [Petrolisthes manimaculis]